ncbi:hypothetical protein [Bradyrhizobium liaoningense]|uniref:hypothetical protein n=1 Tax=Bradyrhizobium liaoningense TaxID=43992 RepID=UPI001BAB3C20|nr:hypothetical protein [Bradyrhizobium liaoningense]MBR0858011.1 hypothetical protein [Bradyrhizobium liaoningense]
MRKASGKGRAPFRSVRGGFDGARETDISPDDVLRRAGHGGVERIRNATESLFFMLFFSLEQASDELLGRDYNGDGLLGK